MIFGTGAVQGCVAAQAAGRALQLRTNGNWTFYIFEKQLAGLNTNRLVGSEKH